MLLIFIKYNTTSKYRHRYRRYFSKVVPIIFFCTTATACPPLIRSKGHPVRNPSTHSKWGASFEAAFSYTWHNSQCHHSPTKYEDALQDEVELIQSLAFELTPNNCPILTYVIQFTYHTILPNIYWFPSKSTQHILSEPPQNSRNLMEQQLSHHIRLDSHMLIPDSTHPRHLDHISHPFNH